MITKLELKRQLFHILCGIVIVLLLEFDLINYVGLFIAFVIGLSISLISRNHKIPVINMFLKTFDRKKDLKEFPGKGAVFYILGSFFAVLFFEKDIAMASILILALGDSISRLVGPYGYLKHPFHNEKFLEGILAGAIAAFLGAIIFVNWVLALSASITAMIIEGIDLRIKNFKIDDNLLIPVISGLVMWLIRLTFY